MTKFQLLSCLEKADLLALLTREGIINPRVCIRYKRHKAFLEYQKAHPDTKRSHLIIDWSIEMHLSTQSIYDDIRSMEKVIL